MILSSFRAGIVAIRMDGGVAYVNSIGARILEGCSLREGENIRQRAGENAFFRILSEALAMNYLPTRLEVELPGKEGERQFLGFTLSELREGERKIGICAFFKDLTHVEMAEESEHLKQRLLSLGQMAAGLAHEIRNPISSIGVHSGILKSRLSQDDKLQTSVDMISKEVGKVEEIIRECLSFVRPAELGIREVRIAALLEGLVARFAALHPGMRFELRAPVGQDPIAEADQGLLEQALGNILANAVDACAGNGLVEIVIGFSRHYAERVRLSRQIETFLPGNPEGEKEYVRIVIRDGGPGIPPDIQDRIFVPFFTTKKTGTGIGLPIAQKIVHAHGGVLDLRSPPGKGAEFVVKIPVRQKSGG